MVKKFQDNTNYTRLSNARLQQECSRILTAAVINSHFRQMLLSNPAKALATGYAGEAFHLANDEQNRLGSIRASSLADFARQMAQVQTAVAYGD